MNIILLENKEIQNNRATVDGRRAEHIVKVLRSRIGERLTVGIINGKIGYGIIKEIHTRQPVRVHLQVFMERFPEPVPPIDMMLALPRPIVFKRIVSQLTALGVNRVYVVNASKVEKSYWESSVIVEDGWKRFVTEGLEQAVDTRMVDFSFFRGFKPFINRMLPEIRNNYDQMLVAHPDSFKRLPDRFRASGGGVLLAIGPEGGWSDYEMEQMLTNGFEDFTLGPRILRVETAVTAIYSAVSLLQAG
jgi:RsmE family RNA methyltransferase